MQVLNSAIMRSLPVVMLCLSCQAIDKGPRLETAMPSQEVKKEAHSDLFAATTNSPCLSGGRSFSSSWTNYLFASFEKEVYRQCDIYADLSCTNKIASETVYVFFDSKFRHKGQQLLSIARSVPDEQVDVFARATFGDYIKYYKPSVAAALWLRQSVNKPDEILRLQLFRPGDFVWENYWQDYLNNTSNKNKIYIGDIASVLWGQLPVSQEQVATFDGAMKNPSLSPIMTWEKINNTMASHFHRQAFYDGCFRVQIRTPDGNSRLLSLGYAERELFNICLESATHSRGVNILLETHKRGKIIDLRFCTKLTKEPLSLHAFGAIMNDMGCKLVYALKYQKGSSGLVGEYFFSTPDQTLQMSAFEIDENGQLVIKECSYYVDVSYYTGVKFSWLSKHEGIMLESSDRIVDLGSDNDVLVKENGEKSRLRLKRLKKSALQDIVLTQHLNGRQEYFCFQKGRLKSISSKWAACAFSGSDDQGPVSFDLNSPVIGRMGALVLRVDCW